MLLSSWLVAMLALFDGHSLAGWSVAGEAQWSVADGAIVAAGDGNGFLLSADEHGDFYLSLEFWVDGSTNSGIFIRCQDRQRVHPDTCYELNIWDQHPRQEARTGAIVFKFMPPLVQVDTVGKWNLYEVRASGPKIVVTVNGEITAILDDADSSPGFIALQHWQTGTVKFRNISLQVLED
jgi:hypothetical protein